jgi:tetratricopeptide (TPR) repeat protein
MDDALVWENVVGLGTCGQIYGYAGQTEKAREMLARLLEIAEERPVDGYYVARAYDGLGDRDKTLEWLERAYEQKSPSMTYLKGGFSHLAGEPRYEDLLKRIGIPPD